MRYRLQIVKHPAKQAVLPFTYPDAHEEPEAGVRLGRFNALPGFAAVLVPAVTR